MQFLMIVALWQVYSGVAKVFGLEYFDHSYSFNTA